jgi:hypothetical protein
MIYSYAINGLPIETGDLICTVNGGEELPGQFWRLIGKLIPGDVDHVAIYIGPEGRCIEAAAKGRVIMFNITDNIWNSEKLFAQRGFIDSFYGIAYPLEGRNLSEQNIFDIRKSVASYCLAQAEAGKKYNLNFLDSSTEKAFYCSQLAYKAYLPHGIDLNTDIGMPNFPGTESIVFPQEIWNGCKRRREEI